MEDLDVTLFPTLETIGKAITHLLHFMPEEAPDFMSNHYHPDTNRWTDMGTYYDETPR